MAAVALIDDTKTSVRTRVRSNPALSAGSA